MMRHASGAALDVKVSDSDDMDRSLNAAVDEVIAAALQTGRQGIHRGCNPSTHGPHDLIA